MHASPVVHAKVARKICWFLHEVLQLNLVEVYRKVIWSCSQLRKEIRLHIHIMNNSMVCLHIICWSIYRRHQDILPYKNWGIIL